MPKKYPMYLPLSRGNSKLGDDAIWQWGLPAVVTCPGRSPECVLACYALRHRYRFPSVQARLEANMAARIHLKDWIASVVGQIAGMRIKAVRIHTSGDFDAAEYVDAWRAIAKARPKTRFYAYTRSWAAGDLAMNASLRAFARLRNVQLWLSFDRSMEEPPKWSGCKRAYMAVDDSDIPAPGSADMVFRVKRKTKAVRIGGIVVCPAERERGAKATCESCRLCIDRTDWVDRQNGKPNALPVVA